MSTRGTTRDPLTDFRAVYCSGIFVPHGSAVTALALLFRKISLPNNIELVRAFARKYRIDLDLGFAKGESLKFSISSEGSEQDPLYDLSKQEQETASKYLFLGAHFFASHHELVPEVFETHLLDDGDIFDVDGVEFIRRGGAGEKNTCKIRFRPVTIEEGDAEMVPQLIADGYVPVVGRFHPPQGRPQLADLSLAKPLAALLAMKSVQMLFPQMQAAHPQVVLEARDRLSDQLPPFWSAMFKLSAELRVRIRDCVSAEEMVREGQELVDTLVRPALIDLREKLIKERRQWFYRILSPVQKALRVLIGNPPLTQQQLLTNALVLGADVAMTAAENMRQIDALKGEAGLTFLVELESYLRDSSAGGRQGLAANKDAAGRRRPRRRRG